MYASAESVGKEKMAKMRKVFTLFDTDGGGSISTDECMELALKHWDVLGFFKKPSVDEVLELFKYIDTNGDNEINFEEFSTYMINIMKQKYTKPLCDYFTSLGLKVEY